MSKVRKRVFLIYQLKRAGIGQCDLFRIYIPVIRPVVEYACPAWHTNLPKYVSENIELIQKRCMKHISPGCSYDDILEMTNLPTLHEWRTTYFNKMNRSNHNLNALLPGRRTVPYALRESNGLPSKVRRQTVIKLIYAMGFIKLSGLLKDLTLSNEPRFKLINLNYFSVCIYVR